jgi:glycosyltransferase involved in cell wall biosynthesis
MSGRRSTVAVIIPTYNGSRFIEETIRSVWAQTRLPDELIVADDCSTDDTLAIVDGLRSRSPTPIRVVRLDKNSGGPAKPMNAGIAATGADLIAVLDQDDIFLPRRLEVLTGLLEDHPDMTISIACGGHLENPRRRLQSARTLGAIRSLGRSQDGVITIDGHKMLAVIIAVGIDVGFPGFMFRRDDWRRKGGMDETLRINADIDLQCWLSLAGRVAFVIHSLYLRRHHASNLSWIEGFQGYYNFARIIVRYAEAARTILDTAFSRQLSARYLQLIHALGWAKRHREAYTRLLATCHRWGWRKDTIEMFAKITYTWLAPHLLGKKFIVQYEKVDEYIRLLDEISRLCDIRPPVPRSNV